MNQAINRIRLFFCFFSGEDDFIIRKCNARIQLCFAIIGFFVALILCCCFISAFYFTDHMFHNPIADTAIGLVWSFLITNLYLLLLYTISPALLPIARKKVVSIKGKKKKVLIKKTVENTNPFQNISLVGRIGLLTFLAGLMTQPINVMLFTSSYEEADRFIATITRILRADPRSWFVTGLGCIVFLLPIYLKFSVRRISEHSFKKDFEGNNVLKGLKHLREQLPNPSDFENLQRQIRSLKINEVRTSDFYFQKALIECRIILDEYESFKIKYSSLLRNKNNEYNRRCRETLLLHLKKLEEINKEKYQEFYVQLIEELKEENFEKYEYWADPPFRSIHKQIISNTQSETDLLQEYYRQKG